MICPRCYEVMECIGHTDSGSTQIWQCPRCGNAEYIYETENTENNNNPSSV